MSGTILARDEPSYRLFPSRRALLENNLLDLEILGRDLLADGAPLDELAAVIGLWDATRVVLDTLTTMEADQ